MTRPDARTHHAATSEAIRLTTTTTSPALPIATDSAPPNHVRVAIIGSGFGGLGAAVQLDRAGIRDWTILERADDVGGTWRDNNYPGCACDVESHLYSFSFALNPAWSRSYSPQPEIQAYLQRCAREFGLRARIRFSHEVRSAAWDDGAGRWRLETARGPLTADAIVMATGPLSDPVVPSIPGLDTFEGRVFHSARWDHEFSLEGKRIAVVGTGASAAQFVPEIQPHVARLHLFQRTAPWVLPRLERPLSSVTQRLFRLVPPLQRAVRGAIYGAREAMVLLFRHPRLMRRAQTVARRYLAHAVRDPVLRAKLTPDFDMGCKRVILSSTYLPALTRPNVEVIASGVTEVRSHSVIASDGTEREVDAIIFATGFRPTDPPLAHALRGRDGRTLSETWAGSPHAYMGTTVVGFPNLFVLLGPNTGLGHTSVVYMIEAQVAHVVAALRHLERTGAAALEPRAEAQAAFVRDVDRRMRGTVWVDGRCRSWYLDPTGRNSTLWPDFTWRFRRRARALVPDDYLLHARPAR